MVTFIALFSIIITCVVIEGDVIDSVQLKKFPALPSVRSDSASGGSVVTRGHYALMQFVYIVQVLSRTFIILSNLIKINKLLRFCCHFTVVFIVLMFVL